MRRRERRAEAATKVCPFCAETIKAAAIRCRFCQSDLSDQPEQRDLGDQPPTEPVTTGPAVEPVDATRESDVRRTGPARRLVLACVVTALLLTTVFGALAFRAWDRERDLADAEEAGRTVRATLPQKLQTILSYDFQTFDQNREKALEQMTPSFREEYEDTLDEIEDRAREQRRSQDAQVVAVAVVRATADQVTTLVFVNRTTSTAGSDRTRILQDRLNATVVRRGGSWLVDDISFPTS